MNALILAVFLLTSSSFCHAQEEYDTLFYFNYRMQRADSSDAKWMAHTTNISEGVYSVETVSSDTSHYQQNRYSDKYIVLSDEKMVIRRTFWDGTDIVPETYEIEVNVIGHYLNLYELELYSKELNIHRKVYSEMLVPICPTYKSIEYHPNCGVAKINYFDSKKDSLWNADGEYMDELFEFEELADSMPVIKYHQSGSYSRNLARVIQEKIDYPDRALELELSGRVYVDYIITKHGKVEQIKVMFDGIHPILNNAAMDIFKRLSIERPAMKDGQPIDLHLRCPITFHVH